MNKTIALIDVGSSTIKYSLYRQKDGRSALVDSISKTTKLSQGLTPHVPLLSEEAIQRTVTEISKLIDLSKNEHPHQLMIFATSVARKAKNINEFSLKLKEQTGKDLKIISAEDEAELFYHGLVDGFNCVNSEIIAVNIGGGSTEITSGANSRIKWRVSIPIGVVVLNESFVTSDPVGENSHLALLGYIGIILKRSKLRRLADPSTAIMIHTGGELTYMKRLEFPLQRFDHSVDHPYFISLNDYINYCDDLRRLNQQQLRNFMPENPEWMDGAITCNATARMIAQHFGISKIIPSDKNLNDGLVLRILSGTN